MIDVIKRCPKCGKNKKRSSGFYKNRTSKDGLNCWCKSCCTEWQREWRKTDAGHIAHVEGNRKYYSTEKGKEASRRKWARRVREFPEKIRARVIARKISIMPCQYPNCSSGQRVEKHHWDYSKPLEVVMLCRKHHAIADKVKAIIDTK